MATNNILPFAVSTDANVLSDEDYAAALAGSGDFVNGVTTGIASAKQANKSWRQSSVIAAAVAQVIVDAGMDVSDSQNYSTIADNLITALNERYLLGFTAVQQGGGPNQTNDKINLGQDTTYGGLLRLAIGGVDKGTILSGTYGATIDGLTNDLPGFGLWFQKVTQRPAFTYQNAAGNVTIVDMAIEPDITALQSSLTSFQTQQSDENATLASGIADCVSGVYGKSSSDYQMLGLYQQGSTGIPVAVYNNGSEVVYEGLQTSLGFTPVQQGGGPNQTADKVAIGNNEGDFQVLRYSINGNDQGPLVSGRYGWVPDAGDLPIFGMHWSATGRPFVGYGTDIADGLTWIGVATYYDVQAVQTSLSTETATRSDQVATLTTDVSNCVSGIYGKGDDDTQMLGFYQQGVSGRPVAVFNNGTTTVFEGIAIAEDITTLQTNLATAQASQADINSTLSSDISNCVSGIYGKSSGDYQILGLYQQGISGRPVVVFNNGTDTIYNGIANYTDVTSEASAREAADTALQTNLTNAQASQATQNSTFTSEIAARVPTNAENDGINAPITLMNYFLGDGTPWASANGVSFSFVKTAPGDGYFKALNLSTDSSGNLLIPDNYGSGRTNSYAPSSYDSEDGYDTVVVGNMRFLSFTTTAYDGQVIDYPIAFSGTPKAPVITSSESQDGSGESVVANINKGSITATGFTAHLARISGSNQYGIPSSQPVTLTIQVMGPK